MKNTNENTGSPLEKIGKAEGFGVPEGYFDRLPGRVMEKIRSGEGLQVSRTVPMRRRVVISLAAAAVILLLVTGTLWLHLERGDGNDLMTGQSLSAYMMTDGLDEQMLFEFMEQENITSGTVTGTPEDDSIINYLVNEGVDESVLAELY